MTNYKISYKELLKIKSQNNPEHAILNFAGVDYTWSDIDKLATIIAHDLYKTGVRKGSHVGICGRNSANWVLTFFAVQKLGAIAMLINYHLKPSELAILVDSGEITHLCLGDASNHVDPDYFDQYIDKLRDASCNPITFGYSFSDCIDFSVRIKEYDRIPKYDEIIVNYDDPAVMIFTSGSSGEPKGVLHTSYSLIHSSHICYNKNHFTSDDSICLTMPLFHIMGMVPGLTGCMLTDSKVYILPAPKTTAILDTIENHGATIFISVPSIFLAIMNNKTFSHEKVLNLKYALIAGAAITEAQMTKLHNSFPNTAFAIGYGLSEMAPVSFTLFGDTLSNLCHTVGVPLDTVEVKTVDITSGDVLGAGMEGEILAKGPHAMLGYYGYPAKNQPIDKDGWLHTGDLGIISENGYINLTGRIKELIIRGGENIAPLEIASALTAQSEIADAKVIGVPSEFWGEEVAAAIILKDGATFNEEKIKQALNKTLADYKIPSYFYVYDSFPLLPSGKVDAKALKLDIISRLSPQ